MKKLKLKMILEQKDEEEEGAPAANKMDDEEEEGDEEEVKPKIKPALKPKPTVQPKKEKIVPADEDVESEDQDEEEDATKANVVEFFVGTISDKENNTNYRILIKQYSLHSAKISIIGTLRDPSSLVSLKRIPRNEAKNILLMLQRGSQTKKR